MVQLVNERDTTQGHARPKKKRELKKNPKHSQYPQSADRYHLEGVSFQSEENFTQ